MGDTMATDQSESWIRPNHFISVNNLLDVNFSHTAVDSLTFTHWDFIGSVVRSLWHGTGALGTAKTWRGNKSEDMDERD